MNRAAFVVAAVLGLALLTAGAQASADPSDPHVSPGQTQFTVGAADAVPASHEIEGVASSGADADPVVSVSTDPFCAVGGAETCSELAHCDNGDVMTYTTYTTQSGSVLLGDNNCPRDVGTSALPELTPGLVLTALRRIDLPGSDLQVQPPNGRTLVNFDTNFYTDNGEFTRTVTLLGQRVQLRIWPARYGWRFGDGEQRWTTTPGDQYPHLEVTHRYLQKGRVSPSVDTTYAAQFRVNGGPWRDVDGTVTIPGAPEQLRVVTARPVLVGG